MNYEISTLFTEEKTKNKIQKLAQKIRNYYKDKNNVVFIFLLKGSFIFFEDITREIGLNIKITFLHVSSYNNKTHSSFKVLIKKILILT
ncbi:phosphoribosyltransferase family protein [Borrelia miyamotoi]|uniref:Phosphoribosyltransferase family protein n=1 Tax=Borrelia miyamotoi TaxID=47466 RepID=A0AAX3JLL0_9SPIR|nr:phosphoribosyltransferase family protein [Borrelia miyamotoi]WAZ71827.1 phosphoribosyltransferase family protein [Borrelia miyamotoi]WVI04697.1 phosphoribosyltransferase family protein [Borrelia miyamotoi]